MSEPAWHYRNPEGVAIVEVAGQPAWTTREGGRVATDAALADLWRTAAGQSLAALVAQSPVDEAATRAAAACLAEAGLLDRVYATAPPAPLSIDRDTAPLASPRSRTVVSIVLVTHQSEAWLDECVGSLRRQTHEPIEIVIVDNGSPEDPTPALAVRFPEVRVARLEPAQSFAAAVNHGVAMATGEYFCLLNPDVVLADDAVEQMVGRARDDARCAAVAAKLRFLWAPAFLNGIGNRVEDRSWGTDNGIGHLDLGQFDDLVEVPSACFAAALIPRRAWAEVGDIDEGFPMYYEDVEWCYRARLLGYVIRPAPKAAVFHAFGSRVGTGERSDLQARKLANVVYGRLRFVVKLLSGPLRWRFLRHYAAEDRSNLWLHWRGGEMSSVRAYGRAWARLVADLPGLLVAHRRLRRRTRTWLDEVFAHQTALPPGLMSHGLPELTIDHVRRVYLPLLAAGTTRPLPEFLRS